MSHQSKHPAPLLDEEVLKQFRVIFKSVRKHFQIIEETIGISGSLLWALSVIAETPGLRVTALAKTMSIHQSTASNIIAKLVELDLVRKERTQQDNRVTDLFITDKGRTQLQLAPTPVRGLLPDVLQHLPRDTLESLHLNLQIIIEQMELLDSPASSTPLADI